MTTQDERLSGDPMGLALSADDKEFVEELRAWLAQNVAPLSVQRRRIPNDPAEQRAFIKSWHELLESGGWLAPGWPDAWGGRNATPTQQVLYERETARYGIPFEMNQVSLSLAANALLTMGTSDHRAAHLPGIRSADEIWCQGFSEPESGSDLASLSTRAEHRQGEWHLTGTKIWNSFAHLADWCLLVARTGKGPRKHDGLTLFLLDMRQPGVLVEPVPTMDGFRKLNSIVLSGAVVAEEDVLGEVGRGWSAILRVLAHERTAVARMVFTLEQELSATVEYLAGERCSATPWMLERLAQLSARTRGAQLTYYRHLHEMLTGDQGSSVSGSIDKLLFSELFQDLLEFRMQLFSATRADPRDIESDPSGLLRVTEKSYLTAFGRTIAGGTSEIQRNIIGERLLDLPRDPRR